MFSFLFRQKQKQRCEALEDLLVEQIIVAMEKTENSESHHLLWQHLSSQLIFFILFQFASFPHMVLTLHQKVIRAHVHSFILQNNWLFYGKEILFDITCQLNKVNITTNKPIANLPGIIFYLRKGSWIWYKLFFELVNTKCIYYSFWIF